MPRHRLLELLLFISFAGILSGCNQHKKADQYSGTHRIITARLYAKAVRDTFVISISIPDSYRAGEKKKYPVVYLLDGNLYFDMMASTLRMYALVGLVPEVILVGVGYVDLQVMDSLRNRDDTYPQAITEYEMSTSGGAPEFLSFIRKELIPYMDKEYPTDTTKNVLMGHSLAGYFTTFALYKTLQEESAGIQGFVAASPSLHYNKYYLLKQLKNLRASSAQLPGIKAYIAFGGLEDNKDDPEEMSLNDVDSSLARVLNSRKFPRLVCKSDQFSNLGHMDTQLPTFIKGLQWILAENSEDLGN